MTTRSGRPFREMTDEREARDGDAVANLVKVLLEHRQRREEEAARRKQQLQQHMETLLKMVQTPGVREEPGTRHQSSGGNSGPDNYKLSRLTEADDIEAYLTTTGHGRVQRGQGAVALPVGSPTDWESPASLCCIVCRGSKRL